MKVVILHQWFLQVGGGDASGANTTTNVDNGDTINNTGTVMAENTELGAAYDAAYETAKYLIGAAEAERFRGVGLNDPALQDLIGNYQTDVSQRELDRLIGLNRGEQAGINELRNVQRGEDLNLIGEYGQQFADSVRSLDPDALSILGSQKSLSDDLYRRAAGDLTAEEEAKSAERAFAMSAQTGRTLDSTRVANVLRSDEDYKASLEARAQGAGSLGYNMSRGLTGDIPSMLLGTGNSPYGSGVGQVIPPMGIGDVIGAGANSYAQQQNFAKSEQQLQQLQNDYRQAEADNDPTAMQQIESTFNNVARGLGLLNTGLDIFANIPDYYNQAKDAFTNVYQGVSTLFGGGSTGSTSSGLAFDPSSAFNTTPTFSTPIDYSSSKFQLDLGL